jgi:hypothetical protein
MLELKTLVGSFLRSKIFPISDAIYDRGWNLLPRFIL